MIGRQVLRDRLRGCLLLLAAVVLVPPLVSASASVARADDESQWLIGAQLTQQLASPVSLTWSGVPLRDALERLAATQQVAVLLDRRIDPGQKLTISITGEPLDDVLQRIADSQQMGTCLLGPLVYFGPQESAGQLRTLAAVADQAVSELPLGRRTVFRRSEAWKWPRLSTPRGLLEELSRKSGLELHGLERVPHDLWPEGDLPPLSLVERLSIVLVGFDLTFRVDPDGQAITIVPIQPPVALVRSYPTPNARALAARLAREFPDAALDATGDGLTVRGRVEDHEQIAALLSGKPIKRPKPATPPSGAVTVYTLNIQNQPVGPLMTQLAGQLKLEVEFAQQEIERAGLSLDMLVSFSVEKATLDELLDAALKPAGLAYRLDGKKLRIVPRK